VSKTEYWVHDLDPFLFQFTENFGIRYYGLAYALGFLVGMWFLHLFCKHGKAVLTPEQQSFTITAMMIGVLLGGRLGYSLFYAMEETLHRPWVIFQIWKGGMASHGGFIGVLVACWRVAKKLKLSFLQLGDLLCPLVPPGILLGRIANFINGELWGKVTNVSWAVIFPQSTMQGTPVELISARHPSQLYEAGLEGALLLIYSQWRLWKTDALNSPGRLTGEFLLIYAVVRVFGEQFREPDASLIFGLSRGSFYSLFLLIGGLFLIWRSKKTA
jgi:phosphatidylglycerol---prolipoprotein diacylglyceryl transferase